MFIYSSSPFRQRALHLLLVQHLQVDDVVLVVELQGLELALDGLLATFLYF